MSDGRGYDGLRAKFATAKAIDMWIGIGRIAPPAHCRARTQSGDTAIQVELNSKIGNGISHVGMANEFSLPRKRQGGAVGSSDRAGAVDNPAHSRLQLQQRVGQCAARESCGCAHWLDGSCRMTTRNDVQAAGKNVFHNAIDELVLDHTELLLIVKRSTEDARQGKQCAASAGQTIGTIVVAD